MKRTVSLLLAMLLCLSVLAGCGKKGDNENSSSNVDRAAVEAAVENLLENYRKADEDTLSIIYNKAEEAIKSSDSADVEGMPEMISVFKDTAVSFEDKTIFEKLIFMVNDVTVDGQTATANVTIYNVDFNAVVEENGTDLLSSVNSLSELTDLPTMHKDCKMVFTLENDTWTLSSVDIEFADVMMLGAVSWLTGKAANAG